MSGTSIKYKAEAFGLGISEPCIETEMIILYIGEMGILICKIEENLDRTSDEKTYYSAETHEYREKTTEWICEAGSTPASYMTCAKKNEESEQRYMVRIHKKAAETIDVLWRRLVNTGGIICGAGRS